MCQESASQHPIKHQVVRGGEAQFMVEVLGTDCVVGMESVGTVPGQ